MANVHILINAIDVDAVGDEWETLVSAGQTIVEAHDRNRWALGDLGRKCERRYGEQSLAQYAAAINVRPKTMYDYTACAAFYDRDERAAFPTLTWSHYRVALRAEDRALLWLARAADEGWSVDALGDALREASGDAPRPRKLIAFDGQLSELCAAEIGDDGEVAAYDVVFRVTPATLARIRGVLRPSAAYTAKLYGFKEGRSSDVAPNQVE
jgi:hypothetical protein